MGAIIVIALKAMVLEVKIFPIILKRNKLEAVSRVNNLFWIESKKILKILMI